MKKSIFTLAIIGMIFGLGLKAYAQGDNLVHIEADNTTGSTVAQGYINLDNVNLQNEEDYEAINEEIDDIDSEPGSERELSCRWMRYDGQWYEVCVEI